MTSLTLGGCDGVYIYSRAAILEWLSVSAIEAVPKWRATIERLFKRVGNIFQNGGLTEDTYSKRYVLLQSVRECALQDD
jgi:hypothetical protein